MTKPFSVRAQPSVIAAINARATKLGQDRTNYILSLVRQDLSEDQSPRRHRFASEDLIGSMRTGLKTGDNATIRRLARRRLHEKNR
jgi:Golgi nucleoside diphosphatase